MRQLKKWSEDASTCMNVSSDVVDWIPTDASTASSINAVAGGVSLTPTDVSSSATKVLSGMEIPLSTAFVNRYLKFTAQADDDFWMAVTTNDDVATTFLQYVSATPLHGLEVGSNVLDIDPTSAVDICIDLQADVLTQEGTNYLSTSVIKFRGGVTVTNLRLCETADEITPFEMPPVVEDKLAAFQFATQQVNNIPASVRNIFGCGGDRSLVMENRDFLPNEKTVFTAAETWTVSTIAEWDAAMAGMQDGDLLQLVDGLNIGIRVIPESFSGSSDTPEGRKYIRGNSDCTGSGGFTFASIARLQLECHYVSISGIKWRPWDAVAFRSIILNRGDFNNYYDSYNDRGGSFVVGHNVMDFDCIGTRVINNYFNGGGQANWQHRGVTFTHNYPNVAGFFTTTDTVIACNSFEHYELPAGQTNHKAVDDVAWARRVGDPPGGSDKYIELAFNRFLNCQNECPSSKTERWYIHHNLYEQQAGFTPNDPMHLSLRAGSSKICCSNIILENGLNNSGGRGIWTNSSDLHGFYNIIVRNGNRGMHFSNTSSEPHPNGGLAYRYEPFINNDWRFNFFLAEEGFDIDSWMDLVNSQTIVAAEPPTGNRFENFYSAIDPSQVGYTERGNAGNQINEAQWNALNPQATRAQQHIGTRVGSVTDFGESKSLPASVTVEAFWLNNMPIVNHCPPWIGSEASAGGLDKVVELS